MPSYATPTRVMRSLGLVRKPRRRRFDPEPQRPAAEMREGPSYEVSRTHALWHSDFHHGKCRVLSASGEWKMPIPLGFLDDHSRLGCQLHVAALHTPRAVNRPLRSSERDGSSNSGISGGGPSRGTPAISRGQASRSRHRA